MWDTLDAHWQACVQEAWAAYAAGSLPIGAVVVNSQGEIIGRGRNRTRETAGEPLAGHRLAHAEVNALLSADFKSNRPEDCTLYASTEPCPLCVGAIVMRNVKRIEYASRDPWAGASNLLEASDYMRRQRVRAIPPHNAELEEVLVAIQTAWHLWAGVERAQPVLDAWAAIAPRGVEVGRHLHNSGELEAWARAERPVAQVLEHIAA